MNKKNKKRDTITVNDILGTVRRGLAVSGNVLYGKARLIAK